ncbi:MAG: PQQ-dependent sugar dehydrogenase [Saprospiraceae bacterium]
MNQLLALLLLASTYAFAQPEVSLDQYATGFNRPVGIVSAGDDRLFILEQSGDIEIIDANGDPLDDPFLEINVNDNANEQGLLGLAFHPNYADNGYFYVNYTANGGGDSKVVRYSVDPTDPNKADPNSALELMSVDQPYSNHNAGDIAFGPDGYLYVGWGDGGSGGDPDEFSQNTTMMLGKMLRIDVDSDTQPYGIPPNNPYLNDSDVLDEIWAIGLRNPWRYSFDRKTGDLWIGDVGQNAKEEVDFIAAADMANGGFNFGWDCREGDIGYEPSNCAASQAFTDPVHVYKMGSQFTCNSITGGYVYRGCEFPDIYGHYLYADYCFGIIWALAPDGNGGWTNTEVFEQAGADISTFGQDNEGNLYVARRNNGRIYKIETDFELDELVYDEPNDQITAPDGYETYQWYKDGNILNGETNQTLENVEAGGSATYYTLLSFGEGDCTLTTEDVVVEFESSLASIPGLSNFEVSPNPFSDELWLDVASQGNLDLSIDILNVTGEVVHSLEQVNTKAYKEKIDLSHLSSGVYFVSIQSKGGKVTRKVVKR